MIFEASVFTKSKATPASIKLDTACLGLNALALSRHFQDIFYLAESFPCYYSPIATRDDTAYV